jgi:hypothetical protein
MARNKGKIAIAVAGVAAVLGVGGALGHQTGTQVAADSHAAASSSASTHRSEPVQAATVPSTTTSTTPAAPPPPVPVMAMTCPAGGTSASPVYGQQITATAPYTVVIDYGDGDVYTNDDQHLAAIFSHTYQRAGTFTVNARLTDATGQSAVATCTYSWTAPAPRPAAAPRPASTPAPANPGGGTSSGGSSSTVGVHPGAFCSPEGATGVTNTGTPMVCSTKPGDSRARWRSA